MDAHDTVTVEEGDRYPLGPPRFTRCSLMVKHVVWDHELKVRFFLSRPIKYPSGENIGRRGCSRDSFLRVRIPPGAP